MSRNPVRVVVADDSALARQLLCDLLGSDPDIEVVGVATDGAEAVSLVVQLRPNIVTMDLRMPGTDGLAATEEIMRRAPTPVLLVTSSDFRLRQTDVFESFRFGVVDVLEKPSPTLDGSQSVPAKALLDKVKVLSRIKVTAAAARAPLDTPRPRPRAVELSLQPASGRVVGIGASTGGPRALPTVLGQLPANIGAPILIAQHISGPFVPAFAEWLAAECRLPVSVAHDGATPAPGQVLVAPGGHNMVLDDAGTVRLNTEPAPAGILPSIDLLLESLARAYGSRAIGVVLTGIGRDGTEGLRAIKDAGGLTLVQDAASCVVAGMPRAALAEGVADREIELSSIGKTIGELVAGRPLPGARS